MHLQSAPVLLHRSLFDRRDEANTSSRPRAIFLAVSAGSLFFLIFALVLVTYARRRLLQREDVSSQTSWRFWNRRSRSYGQLLSHDRIRSLSDSHPAASVDRATVEAESAARSAVEAGVDRNTSLRSVMTLPAYSQAPQESERVIGREGERAGMDTVLEFPETVDVEEARREEEMESLYQIRLVRRREVAERERRREERREARELGDWARLEELRVQSRLRANATVDVSNTDLSAAEMLAEHQTRGRDRRVSSVSYADVGHVRHDGSRVRANSQESERGGLLDGAAPMGGSPGHSRVASGSSSFFSLLPRPRIRDRSTSSMSISTATSEVEMEQPPLISPPLTHHGRRRSSGGRRRPSGNELAANRTSESPPTVPRFTPEVSSGSDDIGESHLPPPFEFGPGPSTVAQPPGYDADWGDAPAYQSPVQERGIAVASSASSTRAHELRGNSIPTPRGSLPTRIPSKAPKLPHIQTLPSIHVEGATEPNTPASPVRRPSG